VANPQVGQQINVGPGMAFIAKEDFMFKKADTKILKVNISSDITFQAGDTYVATDYMNVNFKDETPGEVKIVTKRSTNSDERIEFESYETLIFLEDDKPTELLADFEIKVNIKKPSTPVGNDATKASALEDPTEIRKLVMGSIEKIKAGTSIEYKRPTEI